jgi:hypothetical protein
MLLHFDYGRESDRGFFANDRMEGPVDKSAAYSLPYNLLSGHKI